MSPCVCGLDGVVWIRLRFRVVCGFCFVKFGAGLDSRLRGNDVGGLGMTWVGNDVGGSGMTWVSARMTWVGRE